MLRASWRVRKLALPQGMLPRQSSVKPFSGFVPRLVQPLEQPVHSEPPSDTYPEAGPSNYFTSHVFPTPSTPISPFSAESLALAHPDPSSLSSSDQTHLRAVYNLTNIPKPSRDHAVANATWRNWQKMSAVSRRSLSRQMLQRVLRGVVPSGANMRPYIEAVQRQSVEGRKGELQRDTRIRKGKAEVMSKEKEREEELEEALRMTARDIQGSEGTGSRRHAAFQGSHIPDIGRRLRSILEDLDTLATLRPDTHSPGSSPWDYRFTLMYLARIGDSPSAEKVADTMRHRGVGIKIRHIDARLVALVKYLERSRYKRQSMTGYQVDGVVQTLWKILGDLNTHMGGKEMEWRQITVVLLVQAITLARRIFKRAADKASADALASLRSSAITATSTSTPLLPLGGPASRASDKATELDLLLEEILLKAYGINLTNATFLPVTYNAAGEPVRRAKMTGVVLMALVDHFGRRGEVWKMISVLHAYGEDDAWVAATAVGGGLEGVYRESKQVGVDEQMGEVDVDDGEGGPTLSEMMRQEEEGRKGRTLFGRLRDPAPTPVHSVSTPQTVESTTTDQAAAESSTSSSGLLASPRPGPPSFRIFSDYYPSTPLPQSSASSSLSASTQPITPEPSPLSYPDTVQRTDVYMAALQHSLRTDDWAVTLHILSTAITAVRELRGEWLSARQAREIRRSASPNGHLGQYPHIPAPRLSIHPEFFLRTHIRMTRHRAAPFFIARLQDVLIRAMEDNRAEVRALAEMEGWSEETLTAVVEGEGGGEMGMEMEEQLRGWMGAGWREDLKWVRKGLRGLDERVEGVGKGGSNVLSGAGRYHGHTHRDESVDSAEAEAEGSVQMNGEVRYVAPHMSSSPTSGSANPDMYLSSTSTPTPLSQSILPSAPPSRHLLASLGTHQSLSHILAYSLHKQALRNFVKVRSSLRLEANQMMRAQQAEEAEAARVAEKGERRGRRGKKQRDVEREGEGEMVLAQGAGGVAMA